MAKLSKRAEILETLHSLVDKEAELAQTNISGEPGKDTKITSISDSTEHTDKNNVGPEKLNDQQGYEQKPSKDPSEPSEAVKSGSEGIDKFAKDILASIQAKLAEHAQTNISGSPGNDTDISSVSEKTEHTDKNNVGPDKLNKDQGFEQKDSTDPAAPTKTGSEAEKKASYDLGVAFCEALLKKAGDLKEAQDKEVEKQLFKEAGKRDLDTIIAQAAADIELQEKQAQHEKIAEAQGAEAFDALVKQAQLESLVEENNSLKEKIAHFERLEKEAQVKTDLEKKEAEVTKIAELVTAALKRELDAKTTK